jgi:hypothetical protein
VGKRTSHRDPSWNLSDTRNWSPPSDFLSENLPMKLKEKIEEAGATGYILLWLLGIPIPILLLIFLLRGCT